MSGRVGRTGLAAFRETRDGLLLVVLVDFEVFRLKVADVVPLLVGGDGVNQYQVGLRLNDAGSRCNRLLARLRGTLLGESGSAEPGHSWPAEHGKQGPSDHRNSASAHRTPSFDGTCFDPQKGISTVRFSPEIWPPSESRTTSRTMYVPGRTSKLVFAVMPDLETLSRLPSRR